MPDELLKKTPLHEEHLKLNAKMVPFGGWDMPVQYSGIVDEHKAVRTQAGIFDVSHMGQFEIHGENALQLAQHLTANDVSRLGVGRGQYSFFLNEKGGAIDDIIVYRTGDQTLLIVVNAANIHKDWEHVSRTASDFDRVQVANKSDSYALIALQGPDSESVLQPLIDRDLSDIAFFRIRSASLAGHRILIARTGYTGEGKNGFEIFCAPEDAPFIWQKLLDADGVFPAGLGARDTLRIEASLPLYGHELDETTSPIEAGLSFFVAEDKAFIGSNAVNQQRAEGVDRKLVMLEMIDRGIPRQGYEILSPTGSPIGTVTSGTVAPWIEKNVAMGYVSSAHAEIGQDVSIAIRNRTLKARIVPRPFFKR